MIVRVSTIHHLMLIFASFFFSELHTQLDVDENQDSAADHQISAVPTFIFFDGDQIVNRFSGADPNQLESLIQDLQARWSDKKRKRMIYTPCPTRDENDGICNWYTINI